MPRHINGYKVMKRMFDIFISAVLLIVLFIPILFLGVIIKIDSPGPIFYRQKRIGEKEKEINVFKLRTMYHNSSIGNLKAPEVGDKRVTRVGRILRLTSIDEVPQLINVLMNDMSLVGPRAIPEKEFSSRIDNMMIEDEKNPIIAEYKKYRHAVKPGITGYSQVEGRSTLSAIESAEFDVYYVKNASIKLDAKILLKTILIVIKQKGAK